MMITMSYSITSGVRNVCVCVYTRVCIINYYNYILIDNLKLVYLLPPSSNNNSLPVVMNGTFMKDIQRVVEYALTLLEHCTTHME